MSGEVKIRSGQIRSCQDISGPGHVVSGQSQDRSCQDKVS